MNYDDDLFFTCSLIEFIGRERHLERKDVVAALGADGVKRIYEYADVFHCEPIEKVADDFITMKNIGMGNFDNIDTCKYDVPSCWSIGRVYQRLIEDVSDGDVLKTLFEVYNSMVSDCIQNFNSDCYYQSRDYLRECYKANEILE